MTAIRRLAAILAADVAGFRGWWGRTRESTSNASKQWHGWSASKKASSR